MRVVLHGEEMERRYMLGGGGSNAHKNYVRREVICGTELYTRASYARALVIHKGNHAQEGITHEG